MGNLIQILDCFTPDNMNEFFEKISKDSNLMLKKCRNHMMLRSLHLVILMVYYHHLPRMEPEVDRKSGAAKALEAFISDSQQIKTVCQRIDFPFKDRHGFIKGKFMMMF